MRLAIVATHPTQYYAPWFSWLVREEGLDIKVFYLWDHGIDTQYDEGFGRATTWDVPLLDGYNWELVPNRAQNPGTHHFRGLDNPDLSQRVSEYNPDAVLLLNYKSLSILRFIWQWRKRTILIFRGDSHRMCRGRSWINPAKRVVLRTIFRHIDYFLAVGKQNARYYRNHGVPPRRIFFSPHAIDNDRFRQNVDRHQESVSSWRRKVGVPEGHRIVLYVGKFIPVKCVDVLITAFRQAMLKDVSLVLVGSGPCRDELVRCASGDNSVIFAGFHSQSELPTAYLASSLFILPSSSETWGLSVNEAMVMGNAIGVSNCVGCGPNLVKEGMNGFVFRAGDASDLAGKIRTSFEDGGQTLQRWAEESKKIISRYHFRFASRGLREALKCAGFDTRNDRRTQHLKRKRPVHFWVPELAARPGGIARFDQAAFKALLQEARSGCLISRNDSTSSLREAWPEAPWRLIGTCAIGKRVRKTSFLSRVLAAAFLNRPQMIVVGHLHFAPVALYLKRVFGIPYIVFTYGKEVWSGLSELQRRSLNQADRVIAISRHTANALYAEGVDCFVEILPCAVDTSHFRPLAHGCLIRESLHIPPKATLFVTVARLDRSEREKGIDDVLKCMAMLRRQDQDVYYLVVGDGGDRSRLESLADHLGLVERVKFVGRVDESELPDFYRAGDCFVMPSSKEGFGIVYLEAMACGLPCIAIRGGGADDALVDGFLGILIDPGEKGALLRAMSRFVCEDQSIPFRGRFEELHHEVESRFGEERFREGLVRNLEDVLESRGRI